MINNKLISNNVAANLNKNDVKLDVPKDNKLSVKDFLTKTLKPNLNITKDAIQDFSQSEVGLKLKELINKLLDQINSHKNPNSPVLKQGNKLNLAPNFANELNTLSKELEKDEIFSQSLEKIKQILKPINEMKKADMTNIIKNSGVFFESKLKDALNEEKLPKSFFNLLSTIKSINSEKISTQISELAAKNLSPKESLKALVEILKSNKQENIKTLSNTGFKALLKLNSKIENFKNYIKKDPQIAQNKLNQIVNKLDNELKKIKNDFFKALSKPQNIAIENKEILKDIANSFNKLEQDLKNIKETINQKNEIQKKENVKIDKEFKKEKEEPIKEQDKKEEIPEEKPSTKDKKDEKNYNKKEEKDIKKEIQTENKNNKPQQKESENIKIEKNIEPNKQAIKENENIFFETKSSTSQTNQEIKNQDIFKQNIKNLIFENKNGSMKELEQLSKNLNLLSRKINEGLKQLDLPAFNAKINLNDIKNLENKISLSMKDIPNITQKTQNDIKIDIQNDVKSTLLQISDLAQSSKNEAVLNQANRLLAQIEINQLMSLANNSINTYLPFFWDDLEDSRVVFKRGKKDKFFAQIKLEFAKLGELDVLICLNNEKYIDINIMAENKEFRKKIFENAHELKRAINKAGLLSSNFFVGDIIKNDFNFNKSKNYDLDIGIDKKA